MFFRALIEVRQLPDFHIFDTTDKSGKGGNSKFGRRLDALQVESDLFPRLDHILVVTDADDDAAVQFKLVADQIASAGLARPSKPLVRTAGRPSINLMVVPPGADAGDLETLCEPSARDADRLLGSEADAFCALVSKGKWPARRLTKMWLRASISARSGDPFIPLGKAIADKTAVPLTHRCFDPVAAVLETYRP